MLLDGIKGVVFDMDGVLCDSEEIICEAACNMFKATYGIIVEPEDFLPFVGVGEKKYLGGVAAKYGVELNIIPDKRRTYEIYLELILGRLQPLPGVHAFVTHCREHGIKLAVATSADDVKMKGNLREIGLAESSFDACVTADDVSKTKPDPELFLTAAEKLGLAPKDCLVVEDAINGVKAGKSAGCTVLGLSTSFPAADLKAVGADATADHLQHALESLVIR